MCQIVFIGSRKKLPLIPWDEANPGLTVQDNNPARIPSGAVAQMSSTYLYELGSHMGCACGFGHGEMWGEEHGDRLKDAHALFAYLSDAAVDNQLELFATDWQSIPDIYPEKPHPLSRLLADEWDLEEDVIYKIST